MNNAVFRWISRGPGRPPPFSVKHAVYVTHKTCHGVAMFDVRKDYVTYLRELGRLRQQLRMRVFAYCVLPNAVHLLVDAGVNVARIQQLTQKLASSRVKLLYGDRYTTDTFWKSQCELSSPIASEDLISTCHSIEQQPIFSCLATAQHTYPWSSWRAHTCVSMRMAVRDPIDNFPEYMALGDCQRDRARAYDAAAPACTSWQSQLAQNASQAGYLQSW